LLPWTHPFATKNCSPEHYGKVIQLLSGQFLCVHAHLNSVDPKTCRRCKRARCIDVAHPPMLTSVNKATMVTDEQTALAHMSLFITAVSSRHV